MRWLAGALFALAGTGAEAARFESLIVEHHAGVFTVRAVMVLAAPPAAVRAALTDFAHLERLSPAILESRLLRETASGPLVFTRSKACVGWFCRDLRKTELVEITADAIVATALPEQSNVTSSVTRWQFAADGDATRVVWETAVDPAFFVPPLLGPPLVKAALKREGQTLAIGLERTAQELAREPPAAPPERRVPDG